MFFPSSNFFNVKTGTQKRGAQSFRSGSIHEFLQWLTEAIGIARKYSTCTPIVFFFVFLTICLHCLFLQALLCTWAEIFQLRFFPLFYYSWILLQVAIPFPSLDENLVAFFTGDANFICEKTFCISTMVFQKNDIELRVWFGWGCEISQLRLFYESATVSAKLFKLSMLPVVFYAIVYLVE